jgi:hypothetical protein
MTDTSAPERFAQNLSKNKTTLVYLMYALHLSYDLPRTPPVSIRICVVGWFPEALRGLHHLIHLTQLFLRKLRIWASVNDTNPGRSVQGIPSQTPSGPTFSPESVVHQVPLESDRGKPSTGIRTQLYAPGWTHFCVCGILAKCEMQNKIKEGLERDQT